MTQDEIIEMARQAGFIGNVDIAVKELEAFAKLVEDKTRQELRDEIVYKWVPPSFVDFAVEEEREECAKVCENVYTGEEACGDWPTPEMCANAIRARGEA